MVDFTLPEIDLGIVIVEKDKGSRVLQLAREKGVPGGTIFLGVGTAKRGIMDYFGLNDKKKDLVMMIADGLSLKSALEHIYDSLEFEKPNHGIAYVTDVTNVVGSSTYAVDPESLKKGGEDSMYNAIYTIVERGLGDDVIDAAQKAGSMGGTIIQARGSGIHERQKVFNMTIEPEKEIVLILSQNDITNQIVDSIKNELKIDEPGKGIIFVTDVKETYGIRK